MSSDLVAILEQEAAAEIERILTEARAQAEQVTSDARKEAEVSLETQRARVDDERKTARTRTEGAAVLAASALVLQAKDRAITEIFSHAESELARIRKDKAQYRTVLRGLIREAAGSLEGRIVVEAQRDDLDAVRQAVRELQLDADVRSAEDVSGGVRLSTADGRFVVENTLDSRLARIRPVLAPEVAALLWGQ